MLRTSTGFHSSENIIRYLRREAAQPRGMSVRVVGQHKGSISLDLDTATVLDLKEAVSRDSGLPVSGLKLLAGAEGFIFTCLLYASRESTSIDMLRILVYLVPVLLT